VRIRGNPWPTASPRPHPAFVFVIIFFAIFLLHVPLLQLPYFWDEAGYYVPAARDLLFHGSLIPLTTVSNAHPPLVMAWVAMWWKLFGFAPLVTRSAMLVAAAFSLLGLFRLAERAANTQVAIAATLCTAVYPVFFAQSSLAQVDLAAAGLTFWAIAAYLDDELVASAIWFSLAVLAKETAILAPAALAGWELIHEFFVLRGRASLQGRAGGFRNGASAPAPAFHWRSLWIEKGQSSPRRILALVFPLLPLTLWYGYHYSRTGYVFGNPEFFRYNVASTLNPVRFFFALLLRLWQAFGYLHLWLLTLTMLLALRLQPVKDKIDNEEVERPRIAIPVQMIFFVVIATYVVVMALIGGAVLARYMLTAVPLVIILAVSTLRRRLRHWKPAVATVAFAFCAGWFWNPPYGFSPEDNLAYRDFIVLHEDAEHFLEARYPMARVLTAWPASGEISSPWLGYITRPMHYVPIDDFSLEQVLSAYDFRQKHPDQSFDVALVFSTKYDPPPPFVDVKKSSPELIYLWNRWQEMKRRFFGYHRDLAPQGVIQILGGKVVFQEEHKGQWVAVIEMDRKELMLSAKPLAHISSRSGCATSSSTIPVTMNI
jgi:hypothetical protein